VGGESGLGCRRQRRRGNRREVFEGAVGVDRAGVVQGVEHKLDGDRVFVDVLVGDDHVLLVLLLVVVLEDHVPGALGSLEEAVPEGDYHLVVIGGDLGEEPRARRVVAGVEPPYEPAIGPLLVAGVARLVPVGIVFGWQIKVLGGGVLARGLPEVRAVVGGREPDEVLDLALAAEVLDLVPRHHPALAVPNDLGLFGPRVAEQLVHEDFEFLGRPADAPEPVGAREIASPTGSERRRSAPSLPPLAARARCFNPSTFVSVRLGNH